LNANSRKHIERVMSKERKMKVTLPGSNSDNVIKINQSIVKWYLPYSFRAIDHQRAL
jgi:hypothetical protein